MAWGICKYHKGRTAYTAASDLLFRGKSDLYGFIDSKDDNLFRKICAHSSNFPNILESGEIFRPHYGSFANLNKNEAYKFAYFETFSIDFY